MTGKDLQRRYASHRHFRAQIGRWCIENWHLYRWREFVSVTGAVRWWNWKRVL